MSGPESTSVTVWYDGGCPLCAREIALMKKLDRNDNIRIVDVEKDGATCPINRDLLLQRFHAREGEDGPLLDGAAAFAAMWRAVPGFRLLGLLARNRLVLWVLERLYRVFLVFRPAIQWVVAMVSGKKDPAVPVPK